MKEIFFRNKEVPSLNLCKILKRHGYPQDEGGWYWLEIIDSTPYEKVELIYKSWADLQIEKKETEKWQKLLKEKGIYRPLISEDDFIITKAPTINEMERWLPEKLDLDAKRYRLIIWKNADGYWCGYIPYDCKFKDFEAVQVTGKDWRIKQWGETLPNACAQMVIWLLGNKYIKIDGRRKHD